MSRMHDWFDRHPRFTRMMGVIALAVALAGFAVTIWLNAEQNQRFDAEKAANRAVEAKVAPIICHLVHAYTHPVPGTDNTGRAMQLDQAWRQVGTLVGCPDGAP